MLLCLVGQMRAFEGSKVEDGGRYYLYNLYQSKFLSLGGENGTETTLDNNRPVLCTFNKTSIQYMISTGFNGNGANSLYVADDLRTFGNSADAGVDAQKWTLSKEAGTGTKIIYSLKMTGSGNTNKSLMFNQGVTCGVGVTSEGYNSDKNRWMLVSEDEYNTYKQMKRFTVASLNVDGMPKEIKIAGIYTVSLNPDAKEAAGGTAIGKKLKTMGYDVVGVAEDFNYHSQIWDEAWNNGVTDAENGVWSYNAMTHRGNITASASAIANFLAKKTLFDTDGLGLFYKVVGATPSQESWTQWNEHYGYTDNGADGLIKKGFRYYLITLADGTEFDLYTHHMDAETSDEDNAARASQITQLAEAIKATDNKRPIVVCGDWNCRYTRDPLKRLFIDELDKDERFEVKDPWIEYGRDGVYPITGSSSLMGNDLGFRKGEVVDKILYINNTDSELRISALNYAQDLSFINEQGEPLADHWPCVVEFEYHRYGEEPTAIDVINHDSKSLNVVSTRYYTADGVQQSQPTRGVTIAIDRLNDGSQRTRKFITK